MIATAEDLMLEAQWLWAAETKAVPEKPDAKPVSDVSASWGSVAALLRPGAQIADAILMQLRSAVATSDHDLLIDGHGVLDIPWPMSSDGNIPIPFDILLATTNRPNDVTPSAQVIAEAWNASGYRDYFENNQQVGITTFQDQEIRRYLR